MTRIPEDRKQDLWTLSMLTDQGTVEYYSQFPGEIEEYVEQFISEGVPLDFLKIRYERLPRYFTVEYFLECRKNGKVHCVTDDVIIPEDIQE